MKTDLYIIPVKNKVPDYPTSVWLSNCFARCVFIGSTIPSLD